MTVIFFRRGSENSQLGNFQISPILGVEFIFASLDESSRHQMAVWKLRQFPSLKVSIIIDYLQHIQMNHAAFSEDGRGEVGESAFKE